MYRYGIEYETGLIKDGQFLDFSNTAFAQLQRIVDDFPRYDEDQLRVGDAGIKVKRWYLEGFERYDEAGKVIDSPSKGIEIRTTPQDSITHAVNELKQSYAMMQRRLAQDGMAIAHIAYNPVQGGFTPTPPLQPWELAMRETPEDQSAYLHMMTYGPDVSISSTDWSTEQTIQFAQKLVHYSPFIVALSVNAPFRLGKLTGNKSERIMHRRGIRPAVLCFVPREQELVEGLSPSLTHLARVPHEAGRIEFKGLDCVPNLDFYGAMLALIKGVILSDELDGSRQTPDDDLLVYVAKTGLHDDTVHATVRQLIVAAKRVLDGAEAKLLAPLEELVATRQTYADKLIERYRSQKDIMQLLRNIDIQ